MVVMSAIWLKILVAIDQRNQVIRARKATIDIEVANLHSLVADLKGLREKWSQIVQKSVLVATAMNISAEFPTKRKSKRQLRLISIGRKFFAFSPAKGYEHAHLNFFATCAVRVVCLENSNYLNFFLCRRRICRPINILQNGFLFRVPKQLRDG